MTSPVLFFFRFRPKISFYISVRSLWPSRSVRYFFFGNNFVFRTMAAAAAVAVLFPLEPNLFIAVKFETKQATNEPPTSPIHSQRHTGLIQHFVIRHNTHTHTPKAGGFHHFFCPVPRHHHHTTTTIPPPYHHHHTTASHCLSGVIRLIFFPRNHSEPPVRPHLPH